MPEYTCPHCGNKIYDEDAILCLYCGSSLKRKIGFMGGIKHFYPRAVLIFAVALVIFSFVILVVRR